VAAEVIDGPQSVVWDEAENRLHAQKGILAWCLEGARRPAPAPRPKAPRPKAPRPAGRKAKAKR
jgi:hypothetical protein